MGTETIMDQAGTHAGDLIRGDRCSDTASADRDAPLDLSRRDRIGKWDDESG